MVSREWAQVRIGFAIGSLEIVATGMDFLQHGGHAHSCFFPIRISPSCRRGLAGAALGLGAGRIRRRARSVDCFAPVGRQFDAVGFRQRRAAGIGQGQPDAVSLSGRAKRPAAFGALLRLPASPVCQRRIRRPAEPGGFRGAIRRVSGGALRANRAARALPAVAAGRGRADTLPRSARIADAASRSGSLPDRSGVSGLGPAAGCAAEARSDANAAGGADDDQSGLADRSVSRSRSSAGVQRRAGALAGGAGRRARRRSCGAYRGAARGRHRGLFGRTGRGRSGFFRNAARRVAPVLRRPRNPRSFRARRSGRRMDALFRRQAVLAARGLSPRVFSRAVPRRRQPLRVALRADSRSGRSGRRRGDGGRLSGGSRAAPGLRPQHSHRRRLFALALDGDRAKRLQVH
ncbi:MAG: hypothetical protein BWZ10_02342 [candidate division BRC1 bacterium ADurb.BinA364]|nr:MAG: hypothetical protein BWZ10_02342 [candidate division BRC1 bacterium ADurb.BinA364]